MMPRRSFSKEFKVGICQEIVAGRITKSQVCRDHALSPGMLDRWVSQFKELGPNAFPNSSDADPSVQKRIKQLEAELKRLHLERDFLREAVKKLGIKTPKRRF